MLEFLPTRFVHWHTLLVERTREHLKVKTTNILYRVYHHTHSCSACRISEHRLSFLDNVFTRIFNVQIWHDDATPSQRDRQHSRARIQIYKYRLSRQMCKGTESQRLSTSTPQDWGCIPVSIGAFAHSWLSIQRADPWVVRGTLYTKGVFKNDYMPHVDNSRVPHRLTATRLDAWENPKKANFGRPMLIWGTKSAPH